MAIWGQTTYTEFVGDHSPDEQFTPDMSRCVRKLDINTGAVASRWQAIADILGYNIVKTGPISGGTARYISRSTPLPYVWSTTQPAAIPAQQYLYAANIVRGESLGPVGTTRLVGTGGPPQGGAFLVAGGAAPAAGGTVIGGNFTKYRFTTEFTTRPYDVKSDTAVLAQASTLNTNGVPVVGSFPQSPLFDANSGNAYPDEGQMLSGTAYTAYPNWPPATLPKFSKLSRYITRIFQPNNTLRVLPFGMMKFRSDNNYIRQGTSIKEVTGTVRYTWYFVPEDGVPFGAIQACLNCINKFWFDGFPPMTLLFSGMNLRRFLGALGEVLYTLEYLFNYRPNPARNGGIVVIPQNYTSSNIFILAQQLQPLGWNYQLRIYNVRGQVPFLDYDLIIDDSGNAVVAGRNGYNTPYQFADFASLFRPDQT